MIIVNHSLIDISTLKKASDPGLQIKLAWTESPTGISTF
jgi:hypothetical protein